MLIHHVELSAAHVAAYAAYERFVERHIGVRAEQFDADESLPPQLIAAMGRDGLLGLCVAPEYGGQGRDCLTLGLLSHALGTACASTRSILTVHAMVSLAIARWGTAWQKQRYLPRLASGEYIGALCVTEAEAGSDARSVQTTATRSADGYALRGTKRWVTAGQIADLLLVLTVLDGRPTAFLVETASPGVGRKPIRGMLGVRASMLADITLADCRVADAQLVGRPGFGFSHVMSTALHYGRYTVAWGCAGSAQACLAASLEHTGTRRQFGVTLAEHQLVQAMIADMATDLRAAHLLCHRAGTLIDRAEPSAVMETMIAKYFAARAAKQAADHAVQLHGARGCSPAAAVQRHFRDAKIAEIIEGTTQVSQMTIGANAYQHASGVMA